MSDEQIKMDEMTIQRDKIWDYIVGLIEKDGKNTNILGELVELEHELEQMCNE